MRARAGLDVDEDTLTSAERSEALALFRPGRWSGGKRLEDVLREGRVREEGLPVTLLERPIRAARGLTVAHLLAGAGLVAGGFFLGRWLVRRRRESAADRRAMTATVGCCGLDLFGVCDL